MTLNVAGGRDEPRYHWTEANHPDHHNHLKWSQVDSEALDSVGGTHCSNGNRGIGQDYPLASE